MTQSKNAAYDGKGAVAGDTAPLPERDNADTLGQRAGIDLAEGEAIATQERLEKRDENRWELDADSAQPEL